MLQVAESRSPVIPRCTEEGFRAELKAAGVKVPCKLNWIFGVLDCYTSEMVAGSKFEPYLKAKETAEAKCEFLQASEELLDKALAEVEDVAVDLAGTPVVLADTPVDAPAIETAQAQAQHS